MTNPSHPEPYVYEPPEPGETSREAGARRRRNESNRLNWRWYQAAECAECGQVRFHVSHEMDPEHSLEGPEYHADIAHHLFKERSA